MSLKFSQPTDHVAVLCVAALLTVTPFLAPASAEMSGAEIKKVILQEALANYPTNCVCPYQLDKKHQTCGKRSLYIRRPHGYKPVCYVSDVSQEMVEAYRDSHLGQ